jgi:hypothetical protein
MGKIKKFFLSLIILLLFSCNFANAKTIKKKTYKITSSNKSKLNQLITEFYEDNNKIFTDEDLDKFFPKIYHEINTNNPKLYIILEQLKDDINKAGIGFNIHEGKKTLWVFSSKEALINASSKTANKNPDFTVTPISEIMQFCDEVGIEKMIIDELLPLHRAKN